MTIVCSFRVLANLLNQTNQNIERDSYGTKHCVTVQSKATVHDKIGENAEEEKTGIKALASPYLFHDKCTKDHRNHSHKYCGEAERKHIQPAQFDAKCTEIGVEGTLFAIEIRGADG